jgi:hypothetical protein
LHRDDMGSRLCPSGPTMMPGAIIVGAIMDSATERWQSDFRGVTLPRGNTQGCDGISRPKTPIVCPSIPGPCPAAPGHPICVADDGAFAKIRATSRALSTRSTSAYPPLKGILTQPRPAASPRGLHTSTPPTPARPRARGLGIPEVLRGGASS